MRSCKARRGGLGMRLNAPIFYGFELIHQTISAIGSMVPGVLMTHYPCLDPLIDHTGFRPSLSPGSSTSKDLHYMAQLVEVHY